jgi:phosphoglycerate dehydrogenase-like enzyme
MVFKVGVTRDLITKSGAPCFNPRAFDALKANSDIAWEWVPEDMSELTPDVAARYDAIHLNLPRVTAASVARPDCRVKIIARNGVGYDSVDVSALTAKGIVLTNTPIAVRRPVAVATLTMIFALAGRLFEKDKLVRTNRWNDRVDFMGTGLTERTLGLVGAGSIGQEIIRLAAPFFKRIVATDPYADAGKIAALGASLAPLDTVMRESDFVVACCLLTPETRHLINARALGLMKPTAYFINMGRGPIHDEAALIDVLRRGAIAGAGLDVLEQEPPQADNPLFVLDKTILAPHALCWTDECFEDIATTALRSIADFSLGTRPVHVVDAAAWDKRR